MIHIKRINEIANNNTYNNNEDVKMLKNFDIIDCECRSGGRYLYRVILDENDFRLLKELPLHNSDYDFLKKISNTFRPIAVQFNENLLQGKFLYLDEYNYSNGKFNDREHEVIKIYRNPDIKKLDKYIGVDELRMMDIGYLIKVYKMAQSLHPENGVFSRSGVKMVSRLVWKF